MDAHGAWTDGVGLAVGWGHGGCEARDAGDFCFGQEIDLELRDLEARAVRSAVVEDQLLVGHDLGKTPATLGTIKQNRQKSTWGTNFLSSLPGHADGAFWPSSMELQKMPLPVGTNPMSDSHSVRDHRCSGGVIDNDSDDAGLIEQAIAREGKWLQEGLLDDDHQRQRGLAQQQQWQQAPRNEDRTAERETDMQSLLCTPLWGGPHELTSSQFSHERLYDGVHLAQAPPAGFPSSSGTGAGTGAEPYFETTNSACAKQQIRPSATGSGRSVYDDALPQALGGESALWPAVGAQPPEHSQGGAGRGYRGGGGGDKSGSGGSGGGGGVRRARRDAPEPRSSAADSAWHDGTVVRACALPRQGSGAGMAPPQTAQLPGLIELRGSGGGSGARAAVVEFSAASSTIVRKTSVTKGRGTTASNDAGAVETLRVGDMVRCTFRQRGRYDGPNSCVAAEIDVVQRHFAPSARTSRRPSSLLVRDHLHLRVLGTFCDSPQKRATLASRRASVPLTYVWFTGAETPPAKPTSSSGVRFSAARDRQRSGAKAAAKTATFNRTDNAAAVNSPSTAPGASLRRRRSAADASAPPARPSARAPHLATRWAGRGADGAPARPARAGGYATVASVAPVSKAVSKAAPRVRAPRPGGLGTPRATSGLGRGGARGSIGLRPTFSLGSMGRGRGSLRGGSAPSGGSGGAAGAERVGGAHAFAQSAYGFAEGGGTGSDRKRGVVVTVKGESYGFIRPDVDRHRQVYFQMVNVVGSDLRGAVARECRVRPGDVVSYEVVEDKKNRHKAAKAGRGGGALPKAVHVVVENRKDLMDTVLGNLDAMDIGTRPKSHS